MGYPGRNEDKVFAIEIEQNVDLDGLKADVIMQICKQECSEGTLSRAVNGMCDFERNRKKSMVYLEGSFTSEEVLAIYLAMEMES